MLAVVLGLFVLIGCESQPSPEHHPSDLERSTVLIGCESQPSPELATGTPHTRSSLNRLRISAVARATKRRHQKSRSLNRLRISAVARAGCSAECAFEGS